jgi:LPS O-antigen subunit length determinant protein (WzzB/FepE family)
MKDREIDSPYEDGLNLYEVFETLINYKFTVIFISLISTLIGYCFFLFLETTSTKFIGKMEIKPLPSTEISTFNRLNVLNIAGDILVDNDKTDEGSIKEFFNSQKLINTFLFKFRSLVQVKEAIEESSSKVMNFSGSDEDKFDLINKLSKEFKIIRKDPSNYIYYPSVQFNTTDINESEKILQIAFDKINQKVAEDFLHEIEQYTTSYELAREDKIQNIQLEIDLSVYHYDAKLRARISFLEEQAEIAQHLKIDKPSKDFYFEDQFYYLNGYEVILKELELLNRRKNADVSLHIEKIPELSTSLERLKRDNKIKKINTAIKNSPIYNKDYSFVYYDFSLIDYKSNKIKMESILIISFFLGLVLGISFVLFRKGYQYYRKL